MNTKMFIAAAIAMMGIAGTAIAQTGSASVSGSVSVSLTIAGGRDMTVGDMQRGVAKTVLHGTSTTNGTQTAQFLVVGDQNDKFKVTAASATLGYTGDPGNVGPGDVTTMNGVNPDFSSWGVDAAVGENNAKTSRTGVLGTGFPLDGAGPPSMGQAYLWVGMTFIPVAQQQRGNYSGPASVTIAYYP